MFARSEIHQHKYKLSLVIIFSITVSLAHSCFVSAQENDPWYKLYFNPWMNYQTLDAALQEIPQLTDDQRTIIEAMHEDYLSEIHNKSFAYKTEVLEGTAKRKRQQDGRHNFIRQTPNDSRREASEYDATVQLQWRADKPVIEKKFREEVKSVFNKEQQLIWESITRRLQRDRQFSTEFSQWGWFTFGTCDLIRVVEELNLTEDETVRIKSNLDEFVTEANRILDKVEIDSPRIQLKDYISQRNAPNQERNQDAFKWYEKIKLEAVRMCFTHYDQILNLLSDRSKEKFIQKCCESFWPSLYHNVPAEEALKALRKCDSLSTQTNSRIDNIELSYKSQRNPIYKRIVAKWRYWALNPDSEELAARNVEWQAFNEEARANPGVFMVYAPPGAEDLRQRHLLNLRTCRQLKALFTDEEFEELPAAVQLLLSI